MTRLFRRLPIRLKLFAMIMTTCTLVLMLASLGYLVTDYYQTRRELERDLHAQAAVVLQNSEAPLDFNDPETARETLNTLATKSNIRIACLFDASRKLFASYRHSGETAECPASAPAEGSRFSSEFIELATPGVSRGKTFGEVMLRSDLDALVKRGRIQLGIVILLLAFAVGVGALLSSRLQSIVSEPVINLAKTAGDVSARGDYSLRATRTTDDELGELVDAFNRMLRQIEVREAELSKTNDDLRHEVAERRKAEQERAELLVREREANRLKDEFLATLSHELRTPLNAILGWTKLLRANAVPAQSVDRALEKVERNAQVQSRLIEDLLEVSRIVSGKMRLEYRPFDLVVLCNTAIDSIRPAAETRGVAIHRLFEAATLPTAGDPDRLQQVIWNLLSNAVKFTPAGGTVTLTLRRAGDTDELIVRDTGIGIDPSFLPNVFETFRQADASTTRAHGGLGLGLSIVKQLVDLHGGQVYAASEGTDQGATFTVRLPVRTAERRRSDDPVLPRSERLTGRLAGADIVVVDDDADTRELLISTLERSGAQVRAASSAEEAMTLCKERPPDAVISDLGMPQEDGYALMRKMAQTLGPRTPRVRLALSAFAAPRDKARAIEAGFQRHLAKPIAPSALVRLLDEMLEDTAGAFRTGRS
jgi:signal transduction histidine kinase/ActR/RegA family two-component response regulator